MTDWPNHREAWQEWRRALHSARMHHGWILAGKNGLGKREFASAAARELVAEAGVRQPGGDHPDIITLTYGPKNDKEARAQADGKKFERARSIRVDQIRSMQKRLTTRPTLGSRRAIIIEPADDLERSAANALLKSLEEPPAGTFFLLVTHRPSRLLATIRSRCRVLRFPSLAKAELSAMLAEHAPELPSAAKTAALASADGSFGAAKQFIEQDLSGVADVITSLLTKGDASLQVRSDLSRQIGPRADRHRLDAVLELAQTLVSQQACREQAPDTRIKLIDAHAALVQLAAEAPNYNYDTGLLALELGTLLSQAAPASEHAHG
ncbi:MAG: DNA polymerase III subunit delta' [Pseudomonadota bacterium]